jgi:hypothetical protein
MRRLIWLPIAGFLLVAGAAIAAAAAAPTITPTAQVNQDAASPAPSSAASPSTNNDQNGGPGHPPFGYAWGLGQQAAGAGADLLDQVLSDLVKAGTITQAQSDAITKALQQAITDQQNQAQQQRQEAMQEWQQIQGFLSDGVITQDEVNQLPADSPFRQLFDSIAKNGQVTLQQLQQLHLFGPGMGPGIGGPGGHGPWGGPGGPNGNGNGQNPQASPSGTGTSS